MKAMVDEITMPTTPIGEFGARVTSDGVEFAVFSEHAAKIDLCLFHSTDDRSEFRRIPLKKGEGNRWHVSVNGLAAGQLYAFRANGPFAPADGHRFQPERILLDPHARAIAGEFCWREPQPARNVSDASADQELRPLSPKCVVVDDQFDWSSDTRPAIPWNDTVIYECHVKGMTMLHPEVPVEHRGRYLGLSSPAIIEHLRRLGVTTLELLPVHHRMSEPALLVRGLTNYWGYNTLGFFAPDPRFASGSRGQQVVEFKQMVRTLHAAGIEVVLDVVYNHTAESSGEGPTLSFRGLDNSNYYMLDPDRRSRYRNFSGCGNTLDANNPVVRRMILDSLHYWAAEMHVDGFRFDLASALLREADGQIRNGGLFEEIINDPLLGQLKLIVEPWDAAAGGYRIGQFPAGIREWNDKYRDCVRRFWRRDAGTLAEFATRLSGSDDLFGSPRSPLASVNYLCSHDGFTLADVVSYEHKHNEANGEDNGDGGNSNFSQNLGVEGPTTDPQILNRRESVKRAMMATLAWSLGVPMICMGDELGRTQFGNNNAYCQDGPNFWVSWSLDARQREFLEFTRNAFAIRQSHRTLRRNKVFRGELISDVSKDVLWFREDGAEMTLNDWQDSNRHSIGMAVSDGTALIMLVNASCDTLEFRLPAGMSSLRWRLLLTSDGTDSTEATDAIPVSPRAISHWTLITE